jgi:hypothetical protein
MNKPLWALWAGWLLPVAMAAAAPVAEVVGLSGEAHTGPAAQARALAVGDRLEPGADVRTGDKGRVRLRFVDGSTVVIGDRSVFRIEAFEGARDGKPRQASLLLQLGLIGQTVSPSRGGSWTVRTPSAVTAVRGTEFMVEVGADLDTSVDVQEGKVEIESVDAPDKPRAKSLRQPPILLQPSSPAMVCRRGGDCVFAKSFNPDRLKLKLERLAGV